MLFMAFIFLFFVSLATGDMSLMPIFAVIGILAFVVVAMASGVIGWIVLFIVGLVIYVAIKTSKENRSN